MQLKPVFILHPSFYTDSSYPSETQNIYINLCCCLVVVVLGREGGWRRWQASTADAEVTVRSCGREGDKARLAAGDLAVDPGLILGHSGVDSWEIRFGTTISKTYDSPQDPAAALLAHQRTT